ncbi:VOC family protein [Deinococcus ruber]|uniref:VOC domain-containing protein n=1 Tax=Deinococcus ruber TaxID=1848197 RepID=A0A918FAY2_9DEIO|nr:VOC family protein [Deinococcus ruber]GGR26248.1 hypothetical protein GCM10008957_42240 [Deinococcus ruber]
MNTHLNVVVLHIPEIQRARRYFTDILGFEVAQEHPGNILEFAAAGGAELALMPGEAGRFSADLWLIVPEVDSYHTRLASAGADIVEPLQDGPFGRMFSVLTPDGHRFTFHRGEA